jgi:SAM-dependent methyltransferase
MMMSIPWRPATSLAAIALLLLSYAATGLPAQKLDEGQQRSREAARLFDVLELRPGMVVADVGAGGGEMSAEMASRIGPSGRVYATDISADSLRTLRALALKTPLGNVTVVEGADLATQLPDACCDAVFIRNVYHHFHDPSAMNRSLVAALKPGGRLAIIDFEPAAGSALPEGVPANRGGHGIRAPLVIEELTAAGFSAPRTIMDWPDGQPPVFQRGFLVLMRKP